MIIQLFIFIVIIGVIWVSSYFFWVTYKKLEKFHPLLFYKYSYIKYIFLLVSCLVLSIWIFDISFWTTKTTTKSTGIDIVFVLDVSKSMNALDFKDNNYMYGRLDAAKSMITKFVTQHTDDRFWLIVFAWDASSICPLTLDHDTFLTFLQNVDYRNLTEQGTSLEKAISLWIERLSLSQDRSKVMILISDGWDGDETIDYNFLQKTSLNDDILNVIVWIWTNKWAKIPLGQNPFGEISYQTYQGQEVISQLHEGVLQDLATTLHGIYTTVKSLDDLTTFNNQIGKLEKKALSNWLWSKQKDGTRILGIISFLLFLVYISIVLQERNLFYRKKNIWRK